MASFAEKLPDIPFVPLCVPQPVVTKLWGLETVATFNHGNGNNLVALLLTGTVLSWFAWYVRFSQRAKAINGCSLLRLQMFYYCVAVAIFGVVRGIFDTGRLLLAAAAFHNLGEWGYFGHRWLKRETIPNYYHVVCLYIWLLITAVLVLIPNLSWAVILEQSLGIMCDYYLVFSYLIARIQYRNVPQLRGMWGSALIASILHFFQIYPLVAGTVLGPCHKLSPIIEWLLTSGSIPCFFFYTDFALRWDEIEFGTTFTPYPPAKSNTTTNNNSQTAAMSGTEGPGSATNGSATTGQALSPYQTTNQWSNMGWMIALGFFLGALTILGPGLLPRCVIPTPYPCAVHGSGIAAKVGDVIQGAVSHSEL